MLENLEAIDWAKLHHAYGAAGDVPALLRGALSTDEKEREDAFFKLFSNIYHQGKVYDASAYAVPFLYECLASDATPDKARVASLLAVLAEKGQAWDTELERERHWVKVTHAAVGQHFERLYAYLQHADEELRTDIVRAMTLYPERAAETVPLLESALVVEISEDVQAQMREAIARLNTGLS